MKALFVALTLMLIIACAKKDAVGPSTSNTDDGRGSGTVTGGTTGSSTGATAGTTGATTGSTTGTSTGTTTGTTGVPADQRFNWTDGATTNVNFVKSDLEAFLARKVNKVGTTIPGKINILMGNRPSSSYPSAWAGIIRIAYEEDGATTVNEIYKEYRFEASFKDTISEGGRYHTIAEKNRYNGWTSPTVFKAYTQDQYGSILMVVDGKDDSSLLSGRLYFYNYRNCNGTKPTSVIGVEYQDACWNVQTGPFDCRDYLDASSAAKQDDQIMRMNIALNPFVVWINRQGDNCGVKYRKLVDFAGVNGDKGLNN